MPAAAVAAAAAVGGALISKSASDKASKAATQAADQNNETQRYIFDTTNQNYQPYRDLGSWAMPQLRTNLTSSFAAPSNAFQPVQRGPGATRLPAAPAPTGGPPDAMIARGGGQVTGPRTIPAQPDYASTDYGPGMRPGGNTSGQSFGPTAAGDAAYRATMSSNGQTNGQNLAATYAMLGGGSAPPGIGPNAFATNGAPAAPSGPMGTGNATEPDWNAYIQEYPDVGQWIAEGHGDPSLGPDQTPAQAAAYQFRNSGQGEGRDPPPGFGGAAGGSNPAQPNAFQYGPDYGPAPTFAGYDPASRPDQGTAPGMPDLSAGAFEASPGYEYALKEGLRGVNAYFGAKGVLNSGGALTEAIRQGQGMAQQDYYNWRNAQLAAQNQAFNQFASNRQNTNANFDIDTARGDARTDSARGFDYGQYLDSRNYGTGRFDTQNANLTGLVGIGAGATGAVANAGNAFATGTAANNNSAASATGNAAIAGANSTNALIGNAFNAYGMYAGLRGAPTSSYAGAGGRGFNPAIPGS